MIIPDPRCVLDAIGESRRSLRSWQDRVRDPSLTVLLVLELCLVFLAAPLAAQGLAVARPVAETLVLAVLVMVVILSHRRGAIVAILLAIFVKDTHGKTSHLPAEDLDVILDPAKMTEPGLEGGPAGG